MRLVKTWCFAIPAVLALAGSALGARDPGASAVWPSGTAVVSYETEAALTAALERHPALVVRRIPTLNVAAVSPRGSVERFALQIGAEPGILRVERAAARRSLVESALASLAPAVPFQWQYAAVRADQVPAAVARAAAGFTIAVIDTGADLGARTSARRHRTPTASARGRRTWPTRTGTAPSWRLWPPVRRRTGTGSRASAATHG